MLFLLSPQEITPSDEINFGYLFLRMLLFLGIVLVLILVFLKRVLPYLVSGGRIKSQSVEIRERIPIDQRKSLLVVEVQDRVYLMGCADGQINILMELNPEKVEPAGKTPPASVSFTEVLKRTLSRQKPS